MAASDLLVTKPGGITAAEALCLGLPMALISPIPGQEGRNTSFLTEQLVAVHLEADALPAQLTSLFRDSHRLACMSKLARRLAKPKAARDLAALLENMVSRADGH
jgi:processive 1,2-diacylglycerol beta-glucosyltransferase